MPLITHHAYFRYHSKILPDWFRVYSGTEAECWAALEVGIKRGDGSACVLEDGLTPNVGPMRIRKDEGHQS